MKWSTELFALFICLEKRAAGFSNLFVMCWEDRENCKCPALLHSAITLWVERGGLLETAMATVGSVMSHGRDLSVFGDSVLWWQKLHKYLTESKAGHMFSVPPYEVWCFLRIICGGKFLWVSPFPLLLSWNILCWRERLLQMAFITHFI